jgi:Zn-finger nucleic acid-binding protein
MSSEVVGEGQVDVCAVCGGIWLDWFDGEIREVASRVVQQGVVGRPSGPDSLRNEARAIGACPRCARHMASERYVAKTVEPGPRRHVREEIVTGAEVLRCEDCAGAFLSRTTLEILAALPVPGRPPEVERPETPAPEGASPSEPSQDEPPPGRLARALRAIFGRGGP